MVDYRKKHRYNKDALKLNLNEYEFQFLNDNVELIIRMRCGCHEIYTYIGLASGKTCE